MSADEIRDALAATLAQSNEGGMTCMDTHDARAFLADRDQWKARADKAEAEVARLREALDEVCKLSNSDWLEARMYPHDLLDQISDIAVRAYYNWPRKSA